MDTGLTQARNTANDVHAIIRLMNEYSWALDNNDWDELRRCFAVPMQFLASTMAPVRDVEVLIAGLSSRAGTFAHRRHMQSNGFVRVDGDRAFYTGNMMNPRVQAEKSDHEFFLAGGYYRNEFIRTDAGWKIAIKCWQDVYSEGGLPPAMQKAGVAGYGSSAFPRVLDDLVDGATFGVVDEHASDRAADERMRVHDAIMRIFRAADGAQPAHGRVALAGNATGQIAGKTIAGADALLAALDGKGAARLTHITNEVIDLAGDNAEFASYFFVVTARPEGNAHTGGLLRATLVRDEGLWKATHLALDPLWARGEAAAPEPVHPIMLGAPLAVDDPASDDETAVVAQLHRLIWALDGGSAERIEPLLDARARLETGTDEVEGRAAVIQHLLDERAQTQLRQSYLFNPVVTIEGAEADARFYMLTRRAEADGAVKMFGGRLYASARREGGRVRITDLRFVTDFGPYA
ncbi:nuclear transport factor 2 family protein [Sinisalibacter aestuarii]|uniref:SnoaL-like domain-containing protein n=1 Tax=Sinisalibacter aestuarii TaxID=2949426 RepID=A0ABQ5LPW3_9RHOB|nr:nuclear transport factor 2 family protein [Sinisalibacter aestuarii]GKY87047.1 hypothetical protein STA1M1_09160 [Sinisalibacter aestuarii]